MSVFILELPLFILLVQKGKTGLIASVCAYIVICLFFVAVKLGKRINKPCFSLYYPLVSLILTTAAFLFFYVNWRGSGRLQIVADFLYLPLNQSCLITAVFLGFLSIFGVDYGVACFYALFGGEITAKPFLASDLSIRIYILLSSFLTITLNSKCSPLYPFNDWVDPNTMFTVGKGIFKGYVPYRDLYDHKGPLFSFLHGLASLISFKSFLGVYIFEVAACFLFLWLCYKIAMLYFDKTFFIMIPAVYFVIYRSLPFSSGDTAEEFVLPLLAFSLYVGCKAIKNQELPAKQEFFLIGITSGIIFWIKYSMLGMYLGWFVYFLIFSLRKRLIRKLFSGVVLIISGVVLCTVPVLIYFLANSALNYLWEAYFYNNIFHYQGFAEGVFSSPLSFKIYLGFYDLNKHYTILLYCLELGLIWMFLRKQWRLCLFILLTFMSMLLGIYIGGLGMDYYSLIFSVFVIFGIFPLFECLRQLIGIRKRFDKSIDSLAVLFLALGNIGLCFGSENMYLLEYDKEELMAFRFADFIRRSGVENPNVYNHEMLDSGVNTAAGLIPKMRFFCQNNIDYLDEIKEEQQSCLQNGCADFIVTYTESEYSFPEFDEYVHVDWSPFPTGADRTGPEEFLYGHLYMKKQWFYS
jgi:hypothetical protein